MRDRFGRIPSDTIRKTQIPATNGPRGSGAANRYQQRLRFLQITRVKALREPRVNRSQQFARLLRLALVAPEACQAHRGAQFIGLSLLPFCDPQRRFEGALALVKL